MIRRAVALAPDRTAWHRDTSGALYRLGDVQTARGELEQATLAYRECIEHGRLAGQQPFDDPGLLRDTAVIQECLGDTQQTEGKLDAALATYRDAATLLRRATQLTSSSPVWSRDLGLGLARLGALQSHIREWGEALDSLLESVQALRRAVQDKPNQLELVGRPFREPERSGRRSPGAR